MEKYPRMKERQIEIEKESGRNNYTQALRIVQESFSMAYGRGRTKNAKVGGPTERVIMLDVPTREENLA